MLAEREPLIATTRARSIESEVESATAEFAPSAFAAEEGAGPRATGVQGRSWRRALQTCAFASCAAMLFAFAKNYELGDTNVTLRQYGDSICVLRWDSTDGFRMHKEKGGPERVGQARELLEKTIEKYYPSRLSPGSAPFEVLFEVDDAPHTKCGTHGYAKAHCHFDEWETIFAFGSSPRDNTSLPTMRSATLVQLIPCIAPAETLGSSPTLEVTWNTEPRCKFLEYSKRLEDMSGCDGKSKGLKDYGDCMQYGLFNVEAMPNKSDYEWENLIDKAIWRGSDFMFLWGANQGWPNSKLDGASFFHEILAAKNRTAKMQSLVEGHRISPRFRAVLMSKLRPDIIDAKFFQSNLPGIPQRARARHDPLDVDTSDHIEQDTLGKYRYQLDLGGGGGTTWTGTIPKLAMPGVLFHHETSMRDSYFGLLEPYKHYLPLNEDLSNFDELVQFVRNNPQKAKEISAAANEWVRNFRKLGNLLKHNYWQLAVPLAPVLGMDPIPFNVAHQHL